MPTAIGFRFVAGRYHATQWARHVNEGSVEWPPSPWRILRAIVSAWKTKMGGGDDSLASIVKKLSGLPEFSLPPATLGHTRHYMPLYKGERTLVFDSFAAVEPEAQLCVLWPEAELTTEEKKALDLALKNLNYLGRAESWCVAELIDPTSVTTNCRPGTVDEITGELEAVRVLAPAGSKCCDEARSPHFWPLCRGTQDLRKERWSDPPGSIWATYWRSADCFAGNTRRRRQVHRRQFTIARFALSSRVRPLTTETVSVGEFARRALQSIYGLANGGSASQVFSGRNADGSPRLDHGHAFFLSTDEDQDGRIDHLTIYCKDGFGDTELHAMDDLREFRQIGQNRHMIRPVLIALGTEADFANLDTFRAARKWRSITPYVPVRHTKRRGGTWVDTPAEQLVRELERRNIGTSARVLRQNDHDASRRRWVEYRLERLSGNGAHGQLCGHGFEIEFAESVRGPISLGYGCHFGLGQFGAIE